jgi:hypothetical protein
MMPYRILSSLLLLIFLIPFLIKVSVWFNYCLRYEYYVLVLCENKAKPELKCNGKCRLSKDLKSVDEKSEKPELPQYDKPLSEYNLFLPESLSWLAKSAHQGIEVPESRLSIFYKSPFAAIPFRPPKTSRKLLV